MTEITVVLAKTGERLPGIPTPMLVQQASAAAVAAYLHEGAWYYQWGRYQPTADERVEVVRVVERTGK